MTFKVMTGMQLMMNQNAYPRPTPEDMQSLMSAGEVFNTKYWKCLADAFKVRMHIYPINESSVPKSVNQLFPNNTELAFIMDGENNCAYIE